VISAQVFDTAADIYGGNQAVVTAELANVDCLEALEALKIIRAPFDGNCSSHQKSIGWCGASEWDSRDPNNCYYPEFLSDAWLLAILSGLTVEPV
jgi:hypothetical protein